ncbi:MAG: hypothetical protein ABEJ56_00860 [Candidatus Nanohaloarchaea archaeon]
MTSSYIYNIEDYLTKCRESMGSTSLEIDYYEIVPKETDTGGATPKATGKSIGEVADEWEIFEGQDYMIQVYFEQSKMGRLVYDPGEKEAEFIFFEDEINNGEQIIAALER